MNYQELEAKMKAFIKIEPTLTNEEVDTQATALAKELNLSEAVFWDLMDLSECSFYNHKLFVKCLKLKKISLS